MESLKNEVLINPEIIKKRINRGEFVLPQNRDAETDNQVNKTTELVGYISSKFGFKKTQIEEYNTVITAGKLPN